MKIEKKTFKDFFCVCNCAGCINKIHDISQSNYNIDKNKVPKYSKLRSFDFIFKRENRFFGKFLGQLYLEIMIKKTSFAFQYL